MTEMCFIGDIKIHTHAVEIPFENGQWDEKIDSVAQLLMMMVAEIT